MIKQFFRFPYEEKRQLISSDFEIGVRLFTIHHSPLFENRRPVIQN